MNGTFVLQDQSSRRLFGNFTLDSGRSVLGRSSRCEIVVNDLTVSRRHAELWAQGLSMTVIDLHSRNGTYVNEQRIQKCVIKSGQQLRFGSVSFLLGVTEIDNEEPLSQEPTASCGDTGSATVTRVPALLLSPAERRVFDCLVKGLAEKQISTGLGLSPHTVHNHIREIFRAFHVHSKAELLAQLLQKNGGGAEHGQRSA